MREIPLTKGKVALVDDEDYEALTKWDWHANERKLPNGERGWYACRKTKKGGIHKTIYTHRQICGLTEHHQKTDHIDHDTLNNQRHNLRTCNQTQNLWNQRLSVNNSSGFKGVCWDKNRNKWHAAIRVDKRTMNLGRFNSKEEAAAAYDMAALAFAGQFAFTNQQMR